MTVADLFVPNQPATTPQALARWYANLAQELALGWYTPEQRAALVDHLRRSKAEAYYTETGQLRPWRRRFFERQFIDSFLVASRFLLEAGPAPRILDLGCGLGTQALYFALLGAHVIAVDADAGALQTVAVRKRGYEAAAGRALAVELLCGDALRLDYDSLAPIQGVFSMFAFNIMQPSARLLDRLLPHCAAGARLAILDGNSAAWLSRVWPPARRPVWSPPQFAGELVRRGFRVVAHRGGVTLPPVAWNLLPMKVLRTMDNALNRHWFFPVSHQVLAELPRD